MSQSDKIICFGFPKEAALYFNEVLPVDFAYGWFQFLAHLEPAGVGLSWDAMELGVPLYDLSQCKRVIESLLPNSPNATDLYGNYFVGASWMPLSMIFGKSADAGDLSKALRDDDFRATVELIRKESGVPLQRAATSIRKGGSSVKKVVAMGKPIILEYVNKAGFLGSPSWLSLGSLKQGQDDARTTYAVTLSGLKLVDPALCSWEEIIEFRKDRSSMLSLRRFRTFFSENFSGKDKTYITDKLQLLMYEYEKTAKIWNFRRIDQAVSAIATNKSVLSTSLATIAPAVAGAPIGIAAACGSVVALGGCAITFSRVVADTLAVRSESPVSFMSKLAKLSK